MTAFAVTDPEGHKIADWPGRNGVNATEYLGAVAEVYALGGAQTLRSTTRNPDQTAAAYFWAYDGANLIGTPPRLYNQILREIAWARRTQAATTLDQSKEFVRLFEGRRSAVDCLCTIARRAVLVRLVVAHYLPQEQRSPGG